MNLFHQRYCRQRQSVVAREKPQIISEVLIIQKINSSRLFKSGYMGILASNDATKERLSDFF